MERLFRFSRRAITYILIRRRLRDILHIDRRQKSNVTKEAKTGVMQTLAKECQQPPEAGKNKKQILC